MFKVNRNSAKNGGAFEPTHSLMEFMRQFQDDAVYLEFLVRKLYPEGICCPNRL